MAKRFRILVIRRRYVGDIVHMQPFLRNLRERYPDAWISFLVDEGNAGILEGSCHADEILEIPLGKASGLSDKMQKWRRYLHRLTQARFDLAYDIAQNTRSVLALMLARAKRRVTYDIPGIPVNHRWAYTDRIIVTKEEYRASHIVDFNHRLLQATGVPTPHRIPELKVTETARAEAINHLQAVFGQRKKNLLILHPGSRVACRRWPCDFFAKVADYAQNQLDTDVLLLTGPGETPVARVIRDNMSTPAPFLPETPSFAILAALMAEADLVLCHDSAPMHIAAAVGTRTVALFGSQWTSVWHPLGKGHTILQAPQPCGEACVSPEKCVLSDPYQTFCVRRIEVDEVIRAIENALNAA